MTISEKQASDEWCVARTISMLAAYLPERLRAQVLARIRHFGDAGARVRALNGISNTFPETLAGEIRDEAFATARSIESHWLRSRALIGVAVHIPEHRTQALADALSAVDQLHSDIHRAQALSGMGGLLPSDLVDQAV
ncbi:MAG: hypothetical protein GTO14_12550, partial [Anaerolineales bacterium]|nr:hypothetical protein [Anaerolineales bacterium]